MFFCAFFSISFQIKVILFPVENEDFFYEIADEKQAEIDQEFDWRFRKASQTVENRDHKGRGRHFRQNKAKVFQSRHAVIGVIVEDQLFIE